MLDIPFFSNTKDNLHCEQACLKSLLKFYFPERNYSFSFLDKNTFHKKGKWTWDTGGLILLAKLGIRSIYISNFDYRSFFLKGEEYLRGIWSDEVYRAQRKYSDLKAEQKRAGVLINNNYIKLKKRAASINDIRTLFKRGYILMVQVNPFVLDGINKYGSHLVLVTDISERYVIFHDPGLPPHPNRKVPVSKFLESMEYPTKGSATIIATKRDTKATVNKNRVRRGY